MKEKKNGDSAELASLLERVADQGKILTLGEKDTRIFLLVPYMPGVWEFQVNRLDREFAEDYDAYYAFQAKEGKTYFYK